MNGKEFYSGEDQWCAVSVASDADWAALCGALDQRQWLSDPRFTNLPALLRYRDQFNHVVGGKIHLRAESTHNDWHERF